MDRWMGSIARSFVGVCAVLVAACGGTQGGDTLTGPGGGPARWAVPLLGEGGIQVGDRVMLCRHQVVPSPDPNWADGAMDQYVGKIATVQTFSGADPNGFQCARVDLDSGQFCWRVATLVKVRPVGPGDVVVITRHDPINGDANWTPAMDPFVGRIARVTEHVGRDPQGADVVHVDVDSSAHVWRVRNLVKLDAAAGEPPVGAWVLLTHHNAVGGQENWTPQMDRYVLAQTQVASAGGTDQQGELGVRVQADSGQFFWRSNAVVRIGGQPLPAPGTGPVVGPGAPPGGPQRYAVTLADEGSTSVGDRVLLGRHHVTGGGDPNWTPEMDPFVGRIGTISNFSGRDPNGFMCARLDIDAGRFCWRVRALVRLAPTVGPGDNVILTRHDQMGGGDNWTPEMDPFVGMVARVQAIVGPDPNGQPVVRVDVDGGQYAWRVRNVVRVQPASGDPAPGSFVILTRHVRVSGDDNWTPEMAPHLLQMTRVTGSAGADPTGETGIRVEVDAGRFFWRAMSAVQVRALGGAV
ncbi:MAG: hypothetical protein IT379_41590 [Deltaproteobacteria bacterium]|nr:hypothetical protein [Deltaproteobacteria bacterium]